MIEDLVIQAWKAEFLTAPDLVQLDSNKVIWSRALTNVPTEQLEAMFYKAMEHDTTRIPRANDVLAAYKRFYAALPTKSFQEVESELRPQLPSGGDGPGRRAMIAHKARLEATKGAAIVCNCPPKNGYQWPAQLSPNCEAWICQQTKDCGFYLPIEQTMNAPEPQKRETPSTFETPVVITPRHSQGLQMMADDCQVDLDAMNPQQYADFRAFGKWWRQTFEVGRLTRELMVEHYPRFSEEREKQVT